MDLTKRAISFARRVKNLSRFLVSDKVTEELYGYKQLVVSDSKLRSYYEKYEPNSGWRDYPAFKEEIELRVSI